MQSKATWALDRTPDAQSQLYEWKIAPNYQNNWQFAFWKEKEKEIERLEHVENWKDEEEEEE